MAQSPSVIHLDRAEKAVSLLLSTDQNQQRYRPKTIRPCNEVRQNYLPTFPSISYGPHNYLLLANVPGIHLSPLEKLRRVHGANTDDAISLMKSYRYSGGHEGFHLSEQHITDLAERFQIGESIITFNAERIRSLSASLFALHEEFRVTVLKRPNVALAEPTLNSKQMAILLEFYLQIDVDTFYMKVCSFREPDFWSNMNNSEGLFSEYKGPEARYMVEPCGSLFCTCCHPPNSWRKTRPWPVVDFASSSSHQFVNGYTTYLNCSATCMTSNIVYAMTCPCGHYDYIESTKETLSEALACTYLMQHFLSLAQYERLVQKKEIAGQMRLYRHSARCPVALRVFLDCNPAHWCFVPMTWHDSATESIRVLAQRSNERDPEIANIVRMGAINDRTVARQLDSVPIPPAPYAFSYRQRQQQREFFERLATLPLGRSPYSTIDLYQAKIIAVLPNDCSLLLRYLIETLFIIHCETKLNMICPLGGDPERRYGPPFEPIWCDNLHNGIQNATAEDH
ncbi:unnamed protein product [Adineta ricciae]|uniref:Uncharacterized protein n=1 Tax=Adineta ricciae TaxID=249248 RepID=A0A814J1I0_ADIRI|nr:unnamed protein product [Adineta ricciae]